jgi:hypothetical protein
MADPEAQGARDFSLKQMPKQSVCAEIGVCKGDFAERIMRLYNQKDFT